MSSNDDEMLEELKKSRQLLEPKPAPPAPKGMANEFNRSIESTCWRPNNANSESRLIKCRVGINYGWTIQSRPLHRSSNNVHHCRFRNLHPSEDNKEMGNRIIFPITTFLPEKVEFDFSEYREKDISCGSCVTGEGCPFLDDWKLL